MYISTVLEAAPCSIPHHDSMPRAVVPHMISFDGETMLTGIAHLSIRCCLANVPTRETSGLAHVLLYLPAQTDLNRTT